MTRHIPVLYEEVLKLFSPSQGKTIIDGTLGGAGHAMGLIGQGAKVIGLDRDASALAKVPNHPNLTKIHENFKDLEQILSGTQSLSHLVTVGGILLDLGYSSDQMDDPARGLSYQADGPLDMRLNPAQTLTAEVILNRWEEKDIADALYLYGEEPKSRQIASRIVKARKLAPLTTTGHLMKILNEVYPPHHQARSHPAARTFQALRVAVNDELTDLATVIPQAAARLAEGGILAIITFNSLEDKLVKKTFQALAASTLDHVGRTIAESPLKIGKKIEPTAAEITLNRRARSAKIRWLQRIS